MWHVVGCAAFLAIPVILSPRPPEIAFFSKPTMRDFLANCFMLAFFYLNYYVLIPRILFEKKHFLYGLLIIAGLVFITYLPSLLTGYVPWDVHADLSHCGSGPRLPFPGPILDEPSFLTQVKHNLILFIAVVLFSILLRVRMKLADAETLRQHAEIGTLKNQINPHFPFNTLNNIYALAIREKGNQTATAILKLFRHDALCSNGNSPRACAASERDQLSRLPAKGFIRVHRSFIVPFKGRVYPQQSDPAERGCGNSHWS